LIIPMAGQNGQPKTCDASCRSLPFSHIHDVISSAVFTCEYVRPVNPDEVLDRMTEEEYEKDKFLPYWAEIWPSCQAMFAFLSSDKLPAFSDSATACEIGCGLGVVSALLHDRRLHVVACDIAFDGCRYAARNLRVSRRAPPPVVCCDWRDSPLKTRFDMIVASDVLYEQRWVLPVLNFLKATLSPGGIAYIADPCRHWWREFRETAARQGFAVATVWRQAPAEGKTIVEIARLTPP